MILILDIEVRPGWQFPSFTAEDMEKDYIEVAPDMIDVGIPQSRNTGPKLLASIDLI